MGKYKSRCLQVAGRYVPSDLLVRLSFAVKEQF
jgi:hypothetical protein